MARDEIFDPLPRFTEDEIKEIPAVSGGQIRIRAPRGILNLTRVRTSEPVENWVMTEHEKGTGLVVHQSHRFLINGKTHAVAWVGEHGGDHYAVCDHVAEIDPLASDYEEHAFSCQAIALAINYRATRAREILRNDDYLKRQGDKDSLRKMTSFLVSYVHHHPEAWTGTYKGGVSVIGGLAQTFRRSYEEMQDIVGELESDGKVTVGGLGNQVVALRQAA